MTRFSFHTRNTREVGLRYSAQGLELAGRWEAEGTKTFGLRRVKDSRGWKGWYRDENYNERHSPVEEPIL